MAQIAVGKLEIYRLKKRKNKVEEVAMESKEVQTDEMKSEQKQPNEKIVTKEKIVIKEIVKKVQTASK